MAIIRIEPLTGSNIEVGLKWSGRVAYQIDRHWNAALNLNNLTDRTYYQTVNDVQFGNWYGEPRNYMLTVRASF
ncbi:hypothetical protein ACFPN2_02930 [Steroidobacter flavus]|uniref:TonB-dependent receptor-like beta-barrel domain-containing protein n=1 Tax=Steroidobacter flavus TaxID=1842136 RepID=A0ABV8SK78_9GAMM